MRYGETFGRTSWYYDGQHMIHMMNKKNPGTAHVSPLWYDPRGEISFNSITLDEKNFEFYGKLKADQAFYDREGKVVTAFRHDIQ